MDELLTADAATLARACADDLGKAREARDACRALPPGAAFDEVLAAWDGIGAPLNRTSGLAHLFFQVHPDPAVRAAMAEVEQENSRFATELGLDRQLYERLSGLDLGQAQDPVARRVVEHALRDFRRAGVDRDEAARERIAALRAELVELGQQFSRNIAADVREVLLDSPADLEGLPDDYVAAHPPREDGRVVVTTDPPDAIPFLKFARSRRHRQALHRAWNTRGHPQNLPVLQRLLERRHELARLLGFESWASYVTEDKMIKTEERAAAFIDRVTGLTGARMDEEVAALLAVLSAEDGSVTEVRDHDRAYALERLRQETFRFDAREARPYFPYAAVERGVLATAERLYGVTIRRREGAPVWHEDVRAYELLEDGEVVARFWLDMHPRPDKFKHAAMFDLTSGVAGRSLPSACLVCNMPRPRPGDDALLDPSDVRTFFHEFGHLLHHLFAGRQRFLATSGIATEWDFVEVPSQLFEEWARDPGVLATFAHHHRTGEPIPADLVERMNAAADWGKGLQTRVQMFYAALSLEAYRRDPTGLDTTALVRELKGRYLPMPFEEGTFMQASFGHLDGYSALYYTYMWSLVLAKDCLSAFGGDLMDTAVARRFREAVLAPGGSKDAEDLLADFLGRAPSFDAFESWLAA